MTKSLEALSDEELIAAVEEILKDTEKLQAFDLPMETVKELLKVRVSDEGFDLSPNFQSAGWGENDTKYFRVNLSDVGNDRAILKHELSHALHCLVCTELFNRGLTKERLQKFVTEILEDPGFYEWRKERNGEVAEEQWREAEKIAKEGDIEKAIKSSMIFGSILYQHAYYLDPLMCEAAASTNDGGFAGFNGAINRFVALHLIPDEQVLEGYGWKEAQEAFADAPKDKKAMFMRKADYTREKCFGLLE